MRQPIPSTTPASVAASPHAGVGVDSSSEVEVTEPGLRTPDYDDGEVCPFCGSYVNDVQDHIEYLRSIDDEEHAE